MRMRTADADSGRRTADGGRRTADGGWRMADGGFGRRTKQTIKNKKIKKKYINNQLIIKKKRKRHVEISPGTRCLYFDNKNENY